MCPELVNHVLLNYLSLFPLFSLFLVRTEKITDLPSSSGVENHWRSVKLFFRKIPTRERHINLYFSLYHSYVRGKTKEFKLLGGDEKVKKKLGKRKFATNSNEFVPNFAKKLKKDVLDNDVVFAEDGYQKRKQTTVKSCKFVRRRLNFASIEEGLSKTIVSKGQKPLGVKTRPKKMQRKNERKSIEEIMLEEGQFSKYLVLKKTDEECPLAE